MRLVAGKYRRLVTLSCALATAVPAGCASAPGLIKYAPIPPHVRIAVLSFQDCTISGQEDCSGSGNIAGSIYVRVLASRPQLGAAPLSRPTGAAQPLTDDAAAKYATEKGYDYVLNGEVNDFFRVAPFTFRSERIGITVRLIRASDAKVVVFQNETKKAGNLTTPERMIEKVAEKFRDSI